MSAAFELIAAIHALRQAAANAGLGDPVAVVFGAADQARLNAMMRDLAGKVAADAEPERMVLLGVEVRTEPHEAGARLK